MNPTRLALIIALLFLNATCSLECTRCDLYTSGNLPACCLTFTPPKQVVVWYGTQNGGGMQQTAGGVISNVGSSGQVARPGNLPQSQQMIPSGYQQGMQGSNPPTYLSPQQQSQHPQQPQQQQQQQGSLGLAPSPNYNAQAGNTFQGQGIQNAPEGVQYQPVNQDSTGYNGANTGFQTVSVTAFSQTGGDYNQPSNPSNMQVSQGVYREGQQVWNPQNPPGLIPSQPGSVNAGAQNQGPYIPQQPQRDEQISSTGQPTPYQVTENYDETQRIAGSSSDGRTPTTASPPFTQAPYSRPDTPTQGVFPTVSIGVYSGQTPTTGGTTSGFQSSVSGMPYTPTSSGTTSPFQSSASGMPYTSTSPPYGSSQYAEQGSTSQGVINPSQGIYGTPSSGFGTTQSGSSMGPGQFTPSPYQSSVSQPSSSGYTPSSPTGQYTYQYDQGQTQTSPYVRPSSPTQNLPVAVTPPGQQPADSYQTGGTQYQPQSSTSGFTSSTQPSPYGYQSSGPETQTLPYTTRPPPFTQSTPFPYQTSGAQGQAQTSSTGLSTATQPTYPTVSNALYGQNPYGEFVHPTTQSPQLQYLTGQFDPSAEAAQRGAVQGRYDNTPGNAQFYDAPYNSALTPQAKLLATILAITVLHLEL